MMKLMFVFSCCNSCRFLFCVFAFGILMGNEGRDNVQFKPLLISHQQRTNINHCSTLQLRGGCSEREKYNVNDVLLNLERLSLAKHEELKNSKVETRVDRVIEMAKSLRLTLKSLNKGITEDESSHESQVAEDNTSDNSTDEISKLLTSQTQYDDIFMEEGSSKFRDQVLDVMKEFDLNLEEDANDPQVKALHEAQKQLEEAEQFSKIQEHQIAELKMVLERQQRFEAESNESNHVLLVGTAQKARDVRVPYTNIFETVSEAVISSFHGQMVRVLGGRYFVGNALCYLGINNDSIPFEWPNTMHLTAGWRVNISGETGSEVVGRLFLLKDSVAHLKSISVSSRCSANDSPFLGLNQLSDSGLMEPRITGIVLVEVWGAIDMEQCNATINGGVCAAFIGSATGRFSLCRIGGFGPETGRGSDVLDAPSVRRHLNQLLSDSEPRAAQGISVCNTSRVEMYECELCHIWNGGISVHQYGSVRLDGNKLYDVGYGVGMDDAASLVVTACHIETRDDAILDCAAFYAKPNSSAVRLKSEGNFISGNEWIGRRRPGRVEPPPAAFCEDGADASERARMTLRATSRRRGQDEWSEEGEWDEDEIKRMGVELRTLQQQTE